MSRVLMLSIDKWERLDDKTGEVYRGFYSWFVNDYRESTDKFMGFKPTKLKLSEMAHKNLQGKDLPAWVDIEWDSRPGLDGKAELIVRSVRYVEALVWMLKV